MEREHKILYGLAPTPVPVARPFALCSDREVTGAPFYVMEFCEGVSISDPAGEHLNMSMASRPRIGESMVNAMVELHKLEPADVGLGDLGRPEAYVERQLKRWFDSFQRSHEAAQIDNFLVGSSQPGEAAVRAARGQAPPHAPTGGNR